MCAGALVHARVKHLVFGARGLDFAWVQHRIEVVEGVPRPDCVELLQRFFAARR
jgi:tRNA(adenine34) deaminase